MFNVLFGRHSVPEFVLVSVFIALNDNDIFPAYAFGTFTVRDMFRKLFLRYALVEFRQLLTKRGVTVAEGILQRFQCLYQVMRCGIEYHGTLFP